MSTKGQHQLFVDETYLSLVKAIREAGGHPDRIMREVSAGRMEARTLISIIASNGIRFVFDPEAHELRDDPRFMASHAHRVRKRVVKQSRESTKQGRRLLC